MSTPFDNIEPVAIGTSDPTSLSTSSKQTPEQLRALAAQFESLLIGQMMQAMRSSMSSDDDKEDEDSGFAKGPLADAMYSELSLALSRAGGIGLSQSLMAPLLKQAGITDPSAMSAAMSPGTIMSGDAAGPFASSMASMPSLSALAAGTGVLPSTMPVALAPGRITSPYGWRQDPINGAVKFHAGTDVAMPVGQDVPAAQAGRVSFAGERSGYGLTVEIDHGNGLTTRYAHLSEADVNVGDAVAEGQTIAKSGATGRVTGPHLHFEVLDQGQAVDPASGLARLGTTGQSQY